VDATRTLLLHAAQAEGIRTVMISSAVSGEGKTSLTCQLGASLARAGQRTLIVDFDLRKPSLHELFGLPLTPGIREIMRGEAHASECWRASRIEGLSVLPAGHGDHFRSPLTQEAVQLVFEQLKGEFDFILIDSSPVLPVADALVIGQHTDGVLFSVLRDVSRIPLVTAASQRLERLGVRLLGAVFVGAKGDVYGHSYQYTASAAN
jgi:capsular exopolysaccharide synthesis family protein